MHDRFQVFRQTHRPESNRIISQAYSRDESQFAKALSRMSAAGVPISLWREYWQEILLLEEPATRYFLPSLLRAALEDAAEMDSDQFVVAGLIDRLMPSDEYPERVERLWDLMSSEEIEATLEVLDELKDMTHWPDQVFDLCEQWRTALERKQAQESRSGH